MAEPRIVQSGIYRVVRNPLVSAFWLELVAFTLSAPWPPLAKSATALLLGVLCAWHAREDNRLLCRASPDYADYAGRVLDGPLALLLPTRAIAWTIDAWRVETFAVYAAIGSLAGQIVAVGYGASPVAFVVTLPAGLLGAMTYWRLTRGATTRRIGFSFFGGLLGGVAAFVATCISTGALNARALAAGMTGLAFGHAIGRIGCVAHGCCTGSVLSEERPFAVTYADPSQRINVVRGVRRSVCTPAVILELLGQLAIAAVCGALPSYSVPIWCIGYGALRCVIQSMRVERGAITRVLPAVVLVGVGAASATFDRANTNITWATPSAAEGLLAVTVSLLVGVAFGLRRSLPDVPAVPAGLAG